MKHVVMTFGRMQSPSVGHAKLVQKVIDHAASTGAEHRIYLSKSHDNHSNPIPYDKKVKHAKALFPHANIVDDPDAKSPHHVMRKLSDEGYKHVDMVVGDDRVKEFKDQIGRYVKKDTDPDYDPKKHYNFHKFNVVSAGARDPNAKGTEGASGTKMRGFAKSGDFESFAKNTPTKNVHLVKKIFNDVKNNLKEGVEPIEENLNHEKFQPMVDSFVDFASKHLDIAKKPLITLRKDDQGPQPSFGGYNPSDEGIVVATKNRHPMDIYRTVAHELVHHKQKEDGRLTDVGKDGATGSDIENEANSEAGKIMRFYAKAQPDIFSMKHVTEAKAIFVVGGPSSGKDYILKEAIVQDGLIEVDDIHHAKAKPILENHHSVIVNATAYDALKIQKDKELLESMGYDTMMVFVNTSNKVSRDRNIARALTGGRMMAEVLREQKWNLTQTNKEVFKNLFESNFIAIDNDIDIKTSPQPLVESVQSHITTLSENVKSFINTDKRGSPSTARISLHEKIATKRGNNLKEETMKKKTKPKSNGQIIQDARASGSMGAKLPNGTVVSTRMQGESPQAHEQKMQLARNNNPKAPHPKPKIEVPKPPKPGVVGENPVGSEIKGKSGQPLNHVIHAYKKRTGLDEAFKVFSEASGVSAREWGKPSLTKIYSEGTPGEPKTTGTNKVFKEGNVVAGTGIGDEYDQGKSPGGLVPSMYEDLLPDNQLIRDWALKEDTCRRFEMKYGTKAAQKIVETAHKLQAIA